jgi:hypothetical protein
MCLSFAGVIQPSATAGKVWLCTPTGGRLLEVDRRHVFKTTREATMARIAADSKRRQAVLN